MPGPLRMVAEFCEALYNERFVAIRSPTSMNALASSIELRLNDDGQLHVIRVDPDPGMAILDAIADAASVRRGTPAGLVTAPELRDCAIVVVLSDDQPPDPGLQALARLTARSAVGGEPLLVVVGGGTMPVFGGTPSREARGAVGPLDCAAWLAALPTGLDPFEHRLTTSIAMETAAWDVEILERLAMLPIASAVRPDECVEAWSDGRLTSWIGTKADWSLACLDDWGGRSCEHPLWLAANRPHALKHRVWQGQVAVLLPWIETRRLEIIAHHARQLRPDRDRCGPDIEALDWGPLGHQLRGGTQWLTGIVEDHRRARNELAHGRPLEWSAITRCLSGARRWAAGST